MRLANLIPKEENKKILFSSLKLSQLCSLFPAFVKSLLSLPVPSRPYLMTQ